SAWSGLASGIGPVDPFTYVNSLAFDKSGNLYAAGRFTTAGTNTSAYLGEALLSPSSHILSLTRTGAGTNLVTMLGTPGFNYALDLATNLAAPVNWSPQATNTPANQFFTFTNHNALPRGFYRTRYVP